VHKLTRSAKAATFFGAALYTYYSHRHLGTRGCRCRILKAYGCVSSCRDSGALDREASHLKSKEMTAGAFVLTQRRDHFQHIGSEGTRKPAAVSSPEATAARGSKFRGGRLDANSTKGRYSDVLRLLQRHMRPVIGVSAGWNLCSGGLQAAGPS
jgi:hypothetical protein